VVTPQRETTCNVLPGHSRCSKAIDRGLCPGLDKAPPNCCSNQKRNATSGEISKAVAALDSFARGRVLKGYMFPTGIPGPERSPG
jgi:hypothetical protein